MAARDDAATCQARPKPQMEDDGDATGLGARRAAAQGEEELLPSAKRARTSELLGEMSEVDPVAAAVAYSPALPEDVVAEILVLVQDQVTLFRCSVVSKRWRWIIADPAFLRRLWPEGGPSLLGFFAQRHRINGSARRKISKLFPSLAPAFIPAPDSVLGPGRRFLSSFIRDDAGVLDEAKPLVARGGLVLVRVAPRSSDTNSVLRLCVCHLLTGRRESLPPLDASLLDGDGVRGYGLISAADHDAGPHRLVDGYSTLFQVLLIGLAQENRHLHLIKFSSAAAGSRRWKDYDCSRRIIGGVRMGPSGCSIAAIADGTAHWLFRGNNPDNPRVFTLDVSVNTGHITSTMLPFGLLHHNDAWLCTIDARLSILCFINKLLVVSSHGYNNEGTLDWHPSRLLVIRNNEGLSGETLSFVCAGENSGTVLALYHSNPECAYMLDLKSLSATKVAGWTRRFNYMTVVPCEINWPKFFMSRLGVQM